MARRSGRGRRPTPDRGYLSEIAVHSHSPGRQERSSGNSCRGPPNAGPRTESNMLPGHSRADLGARLSQTRTSFSYAEGCTSGCDAVELLDERSACIQRPRSKILTDLRCSADSSGASITVARRPRSFVRTRTKVAFTSESVFIMLCADFLAPSVRRTRLTNVKPITVANVCNRNELSAHWCEGPQGATPPFLARRNNSSTFHWPRKACTMRPVLQRCRSVHNTRRPRRVRSSSLRRAASTCQ